MSVRGVWFILLSSFWIVACAYAAPAQARARRPVRYTLSIPEPQTQYVEVALHVADPSGKQTAVAMPAWTPGSYLVRDYAKHVYGVQAQGAGGRAVRVEKLDKQTWQVVHGGRPFTLRYRIYAAEHSPRTSHVDDRHASINGASVFMYLVGELARPAELAVEPPPGWGVHTALPAAGDGTFAAPDYDTLVDAPLELGTPQVRTFEVDGTRFEYVLTGADAAGADVDRLAGDAETIVASFGDLMGGFPMKRYVFLMSFTQRGGGGLEHADSTMMLMRRRAFASEEAYAQSARLTAHEFFHLWNVKRIHDKALGPFDYTRENHSRLLWFHEGFTDTAESLALIHAGLVSPKEHLERLARQWTRYRRKPGRNRVPVSEISFDAWTQLYKPETNHRLEIVSYYQKGELLGVALDLEIRRRAQQNGRAGDLFGVFRRLMESHGAKSRGIELEEIVHAASKEAGEDMSQFFERHVLGTTEVPLLELLPEFGVEIEAKAADKPWAGLRLEGTQVRGVDPQSPAAKAGLMPGDEIVAADGFRTADEGAIRRRFEIAGNGRGVALHVFRDGRLLERQLTLRDDPRRTYTFALAPRDNLEKDVLKRRDRWLRSKVAAKAP